MSDWNDPLLKFLASTEPLITDKVRYCKYRTNFLQYCRIEIEDHEIYGLRSLIVLVGSRYFRNEQTMLAPKQLVEIVSESEIMRIHMMLKGA